jgi:hypothetical protein
MTRLQQVNKIVIKMLNKHENSSETSKSKRQKPKQKECMTNILPHLLRFFLVWPSLEQF